MSGFIEDDLFLASGFFTNKKHGKPTSKSRPPPREPTYAPPSTSPVTPDKSFIEETVKPPKKQLTPRDSSHKLSKKKQPTVVPTTNTTVVADINKIIQDSWGDLSTVPLSKPRKLRIDVAKHLTNSFLSDGTVDNNAATVMASKVETAMYDRYFAFNQTEYRNIARDLCLMVSKCPQCFMSFDSVVVATMTTEEMNTAIANFKASNPLNTEILTEAKPVPHKIDNALLQPKESDIPCKKCKKKTVMYTTISTRALDEPAQMFYYCRSCSARW